MNNGGWGLKIMLFFCAFFMFFIIMSAAMVNKNFKELAPKNNTDEKITYFDLEVKMVNATKKYITRTYSDIKEDIEIPVKLKTLVDSEYLAPIKDLYTNLECNGYVIFIRKNNKIEYHPYLKCDNYKTNGYDGSLD